MKKLLNKVKHTYLQVKLWTLIQLNLRTVNKDDRIIYKTLLDNTAKNYLYNPQPTVPPHTTIKLVKCVIDRLIPLKQAVLFQPMTGPVGMAYLLRLRQTEPMNVAPSAEHVPYHITLEIMHEVLEAKVVAFSHRWRMEAMQDLAHVYGLIAEEEFLSVASATVAEEIITHILRAVKELATDHRSSTTEQLPFVFNQAANRIAVKTRRGQGNVIITTPIGLELITNAPVGYQFIPVPVSCGGPLTYVGDLCTHEDPPYAKYKVLVTQTALESNDDVVEFLVAYRNPSNEIDAGYVYAPYIPLFFTGMMIDPESFSPTVKLYTRHGAVANGEHAGDYFSVIRVNLKKTEHEG